MGKLPDINQTYYLEAPPSKVFEALTDSKALVKWFPVKGLLDPVKGGRFSFVMKNGFVWEGKVSGFVEGKSVSVPCMKGTATFNIARKGKGTLLKLRHTGIETSETLVGLSGGWSYYLTNLKSVLDHGVDLRAEEDSF